MADPTRSREPGPGAAGCSDYLPVSEHGLIGDLHCVALVGTNGTIDWHCCPSFDSPSVFGSIPDADRCGSFELAAAVPAKTRQFYLPDTNVLITRFFAEEGVGEIQDFMPVGGAGETQRHLLIRRVLCARGTMPFRAQVAPRFDYGRQPHTLTEVEAGVVFTTPNSAAGLTATVPFGHDGRDVTAEFKLAEGEYEGGDVLDASVLLMPLVKFISPTVPKWLSTLEALTTSLVSDSLVYRYDPRASPDGVRGEEGIFSACSFWNVEALTRAGRLEEARLAFEKMLTYGNHLGLYAEEISRTGEQQGNFPQALTHLALISAAFNLDRALDSPTASAGGWP